MTTHAQASAALLISLTRLSATVPRFKTAFQRFSNNSLNIPVRLVDSFDGSTATGKTLASFRNFESSKNVQDISVSFVRDKFHKVTAAHEATHVLQYLNNEDPRPELQLPYNERPSEIEAISKQTATARFIDRVETIDSSIFETNSETVRTSKLLKALRILKLEQELNLQQEIREATADPENALPDTGAYETEEIVTLTTQIELLKERLDNLIEDTSSEDSTDL